MYKDVFGLLIDILPESLQANLLAKKVSQQLATKEFHSDLNIKFRDETKLEKLFHRKNNVYMPAIEVFQIEFLNKHHNDLFIGHLAIIKIYHTLCREYFWPNMYKQEDK